MQSSYDYYVPCCEFGDSELSDDAHVSAAIALIEAGADYELPSDFVVGIGADLSTGGQASVKASDDDQSFSVETGRSMSAYARVGRTFGGTMLAYGLLGVTRTEVDESYTATNADLGHTYSAWRSGLTLGAGIETMVSEKVSLKLEYRYTDLGSETHTESYSVDYLDDLAASSKLTQQSARAVLSYRF